MDGRVVFLGTSAAVPTPNRGLPAILLKLGSLCMLLDAGEGVQERLLRAGSSPLKIDAVVLTHFHGDHVFGLPGLLHSMSMHGRSKPLKVFGPPGTKAFLRHIDELTGHKPCFEVKVLEFARPEGVVEVERGVLLEWFEVSHVPGSYGVKVVVRKAKGKIDVRKLKELGIPEGPHLAQLQRGIPVRLPGGRVVEPKDVLKEPPSEVSVVYTGDTRRIDTIVRKSRGASVLIHDSTFSSEDRDHAWLLGHSTSVDAALTAREAGVKLLVLTHFSARYDDLRVLEREARRYFQETIAAEDFMVLPLRTG